VVFCGTKNFRRELFNVQSDITGISEEIRAPQDDMPALLRLNPMITFRNQGLILHRKSSDVSNKAGNINNR
jgi:hypothetical protein